MFTHEAIGSQDAAPVTPPAGYLYPLGLGCDLAKRDYAPRHPSDLPTWGN
jgi:hypothetical protein